MIFQLREKELGTVCDVEVYCDSELDCIEINSSVFVEGYSKLLAKNLGRVNEIIQDFTEIEDLRGWLWEKYFMKNKNIFLSLLMVVIIGFTSCSVNKYATKSAPIPITKEAASPNKAEPVPGAEILIEQEKDQVPKQ